ncbi:glycosyltransferase domain-containing protein [Marinibacterium sp. SX1]|uniref:sulfotransferase family protein n=1 Tax=Marinibacterium sp. SX1 TaxID=3388424 RepID=UPI003D16C984
MIERPLPSRIVLVPGMHRSGSSAVARVLGLLGHELPRTLIKDNASNRRGHWESEPVVRLNEAYLRRAGLAWSDWIAGALPRMGAQDRRDFEADLRAVIADEFPAGRPAVLKDPRLCRLLPRYRAGLEGQCTVEAVIPLRNPLAVIGSLARRNDMSRGQAGLLWLRHMLEAETGSRGMARAFIDYDRLLADPLPVLDAAQAALGRAMPLAPGDVADEVTAFLDAGLRGHAHTAEDVLHDDLARGWISDAHEALARLVRDPADGRAQAVIDRVTAEFDAAAPMLGHLTGEADRTGAELRRGNAALTASLELRREQIEVLRAQGEELAAQVETERRAGQTALADLRAELDAAEAKARAGQEAERAKAETVLQEHRDAAREDRRLARRAQEAAQAQAEELARETAMQTALAERLRIEVRTQKEVFADQKARIAGLTAELDEAQKTGAKAERRAGRKAAEVNDLARRVEQLEAEVALYRRAHAEVLASTSWRLTWPLRAVLNGLRGKGLAAPGAPEVPDAAAAQPAGGKGDAPQVAENAAAPLKDDGTAAQLSDDKASASRADDKTATPQQAAPEKTAPALVRAEDVARIEKSGQFDAAYYADRYPDAREFAEGPAAHYLQVGWRKGFDPSAGFVARAYEHSHADILKDGDCPLLHFLELYPDGTRPDRAPYADHAKGGPKVAVYTAISGGYDRLNEPQGPVGDTDFFVFTDGEVPAGSAWTRRALEYVDADPVRTARFVKTHPHLYFGDYDFAIWVDANLALRSDPRELLPAPGDKAPVYTWHHPLRDCVYDEGRICIELNKDEESVIRAAMARLERENFPRNAGMMETSVFVNRMGDPRTAEFHNRWWARIEQGSRRDQLSLPPVLHEMGLDIGHIAHKRICMRSDPRFGFNSHVRPNEPRKDAGAAPDKRGAAA